MIDDVTVRSAAGDDFASVLELWTDTQPSHTDDVRGLQRLLKHDKGALIVAELDGRIIGSVIATFDGWRGNLYRLVVHPQMRRRGLGATLIGAGEAHLAELGARRLTALVFRNEAAKKAWASAGYDTDPRVERHAKNLS